MSRKTRAFALAAATASLVGLSAPVAGAATLQGGPSGFNNDSVLNLSGNQIPVQLCNNDIPVNVLGVQVPLSAISAVLGVLNSGALTGSASKTCTQNPTETNTTTTNTGSTITNTGSHGPVVFHRWVHRTGDHQGTTTNGFNNDSVLNVSGNQLPVQACNNDIPVNVAGVQVPVDGVSGVLGLLNSGPLSSSADRSCTQNPTETNTSTTTTGNTITNG